MTWDSWCGARPSNSFARWYRQRPELQLSLNISKRQLFAPEFVDTLLQDVAHYGLPPAAVILEVTESVALMEVEFAEERLRQLVLLGFTLSIDGLRHRLRILVAATRTAGRRIEDRHFLRATSAHAPTACAFCRRSSISPAPWALRTVAEGVEDEATATTPVPA